MVSLAGLAPALTVRETVCLAASRQGHVKTGTDGPIRTDTERVLSALPPASWATSANGEPGGNQTLAHGVADHAPRQRTGSLRGVGENRTRIAWVQARHSPVEIRPLKKSVETSRLVRESNPSHPVDSGAATPVASQGSFQFSFQRTWVPGAGFEPATLVSETSVLAS